MLIPHPVASEHRWLVTAPRWIHSVPDVSGRRSWCCGCYAWLWNLHDVTNTSRCCENPAQAKAPRGILAPPLSGIHRSESSPSGSFAIQVSWGCSFSDPVCSTTMLCRPTSSGCSFHSAPCYAVLLPGQGTCDWNISSAYCYSTMLILLQAMVSSVHYVIRLRSYFPRPVYMRLLYLQSTMLHHYATLFPQAKVNQAALFPVHYVTIQCVVIKFQSATGP